ncbi:MAG: biopolymer transporter ExbD [Neisseria sp.]|nr:biopolymer transporter ExbD [Neisseria sp.]
MNFRSRRRAEEPEINFIPLIDLLLVILIFLMVTTTYNRLQGLNIQLPTADSPTVETLQQQDILLAVTADGWQLDHRPVPDLAALSTALHQAAQQRDDEAWVIVYADADTPYQRVIDTMQAAQKAGLTRITLASDAPTETAD